MDESPELFTTRMRKATRKIHSISDALVNAKFAISLREETVWGGGLFVFYHVFAYLEDAKERLQMDDYNKLFVHKILLRKKEFEEDLSHYLGEEWPTMPKPSALENYLEHLQALEKDNPRMLMVYVYHLYLGLLSGAQILAKKRRMFARENPTVKTYKDKVTNFSDVDVPQLKNEFRKAMNEIAEKMAEEEKDAFIEESKQVFLLNNMIVNSVGGQNQVIKAMLYKGVILGFVLFGAFLALKWHK